jgi:hypothetical protein
MVMYLLFGPLVLVKLHFRPCFEKIIALVPKLRRLNLVFFYALESLNCVVLGCFLVYFRIFVVGSPNNSQ